MMTTRIEDLTWLEGIAVAATVCNLDGICVYLNQQAARQFAEHGGRALVGKSLLDCHPERARRIFAAQLASPTPNTYTIEKSGKRKIVHQIPWYQDEVFSGVVELSFELPENMPHFARDSAS